MVTSTSARASARATLRPPKPPPTTTTRLRCVCIRTTSSVDFRFRYRGPGLQEIEVAALVRLRDVLQVQRAIAPRILGRLGLPVRAALLESVVIDLEVQPPGGHVQFDDVTVLDEAQRAADRRLGRHMERTGAIAGAAHPGVGY